MDAFKAKRRLATFGFLAFVLLALAYGTDRMLLGAYARLESPATLDRNGLVLALAPNPKQEYGRYLDSLPPHVADLLVRKEDRFFYFLPGVNPVSMARATYGYLSGARTGGGSTIPEQLAKNLLGDEQDRTVANKLAETFDALCLSLFNSKQELLTMYANTVYMGNQVEGLEAASELYFGMKLADLDDTKLAMLLATLSSPSTQNPWQEANATAARNLAARLGLRFDPRLAIVTAAHAYAPPQDLELASMHETCASTCTTTLDGDLTRRLRAMLKAHVEKAWDAGARSGAIVVIKLPENQLLAIVGTPDASGTAAGQQINMATEPRPIGSTVKPFIYLDGFSKGLRPYTLVDDREYKFPIGSGFPLYPKNYDGMYRGWITLHEALSNSLNVPTVKTLEYIGLPNFYSFLEDTLHFSPLQDLDHYQYGIALGALEMDPLTLAEYLTLFPRYGTLGPLRLFLDGTTTPYIETPMSAITATRRIADPALTELVTKVLNDRLTGVEQFGLASSLNLSESNYAVKTGTSENFHDSWTVGYTPDFLVAVWFGSPDNAQLKQVTGQEGAGTVWHDAMEMLMNSPYNRHTPFDFSKVQDFMIDGSVDFGLPGDTVSAHRNLLPDNDLIFSPVDGDRFLLEPHTAIPLVSPQTVDWYANGVSLGTGERIIFSPHAAGNYRITAVSLDGVSASITVDVTATP
ncbi:MAG: transglycosylase domain-containing protein [Patescibacteria group bacterium]|nr:transglycosylase domain-containing protein [Patescibacteria group bacterium]MDE1965922.1 transglycosylase domain-containing protein [Patescibacteria group bacterium]